MPLDIDPVLGTLIGIVITGFFAVVTAMIARASTRGATSVQFAQTVIGRLESVEDDLTEVRKELAQAQEKQKNTDNILDASIRLIRELVDWGRSGGKTKLPVLTDKLHEYIDPEWYAANNNEPADKV